MPFSKRRGTDGEFKRGEVEQRAVSRSNAADHYYFREVSRMIKDVELILLGHKIFIADCYCMVQHSMGIVAVIGRAR